MLHMRISKQEDVVQLKLLWEASFNDTSEGIGLFFDKRFMPENACVALDGGLIIAAAYLLPVKALGGLAHYIYAVATLPEYRGQGVMKGLMKYAEYISKQRGAAFSVLLPASEKLYGYYEKLGYSTCCAETVLIEKAVNFTDKSDEHELFCLEKSITPEAAKKMFEVRKNLSGQYLEWNAEDISYAVEQNSLYGGFTVLSKSGYAICQKPSADSVKVSELIFKDKESYENILNIIFSEAGTAEAEIHTAPSLLTKATQKKHGMVLAYEGNLPKDLYIGLTLE